jgi:hypothetical protein
VYAVTFFSVGCGVAAGEVGACALEAGTGYCGATDAEGWGGRAARVGLRASETPKTARKSKIAFNLWFAKLVVLFAMCTILAPVRNVPVVCFE